MAYLIYVTDHDGMEETRERLRNAHRDHLRSAGKKLIASGALLDDSGAKVIGGLSILDTDDKEEALRFAHEDPYAKAGVPKENRVIRWRRRWADGEFLGNVSS